MRRTLTIVPLVFALACSQPYANVPPEPPTLYKLGEKSLRAGKYEQARDVFRSFLDGTPDATFRARAYYQLARALYRLEEYEEVLQVLGRLDAEFPEQNWPQVSALRGDAQAALGNRTGAFLAWEEAWFRSPPDDRALLQSRMEAHAVDLTEEEALELDALATLPVVRQALVPRLPPPLVTEDSREVPAPQFDESEALPPVEVLALEEGLPPETVGEPETGPYVTGEIVTAERPIASLPPDTVSAGPLTPKVACLLPLTGADRTYGARSLAGLRLAFVDAPEMLVVRDTGGDPKNAVKLLAELAARPSIVAVVGPLRSSEAQEVTPQAVTLRIPLLTLAPGAGSSAGGYVFPAAVTASQQVRALVAHAMGSLSAKRFAVLYPDDGYGTRFLQLFRTEVRQRGGRLVGSAAYVPGQPDFAHEVRLARDWKRSSGLDAVFVPDAAERAVTLGAALRLEIPDLILLGTESWNRPAAIAQVGSRLDGAVFTDAFFSDSVRPATRAFVDRFAVYTGRAPTVFEAQAFDAGLLVRRAVDEGAVTREDVLARLTSPAAFEGAGRLNPTAAGFERQLFLLQVRNGRVTEIDAFRSSSDAPG